MTVAIDVGCARYGGDYSIERLLDRFNPTVLYGFDPNWVASMYVHDVRRRTVVDISNEAAWIEDGQVAFQRDGLNSTLSSNPRMPLVPCIDLARFISELPPMPTVLKMDAEGSEYELLTHLIDEGVTHRLQLVWVEWHSHGVVAPDLSRKWIEEHLGCPYEEWPW